MWRIRRGIPRFGVDLSEDGLPTEAGWDGLIDRTKGCFLGQEAVAKVRNLGHPPRLIVPLHSARPVKAGQTILAATREVGTVTSAAPDGEGSALLGRVRWEARDAELRTASGHPLARRAA